jgi:hypothetical protein
MIRVGIISCRFHFLNYTRKVKLGSVAKLMIVVSALPLCGTGCSSISAAPSFSPLMFFLPGLVQTKPPLLQPPVPGQTATNWIMAQAKLNLCDSHLP